MSLYVSLGSMDSNCIITKKTHGVGLSMEKNKDEIELLVQLNMEKWRKKLDRSTKSDHLHTIMSTRLSSLPFLSFIPFSLPWNLSLRQYRYHCDVAVKEWEVTHMRSTYYDASIDFNFLCQWGIFEMARREMETHVSHIILHMLH